MKGRRRREIRCRAASRSQVSGRPAFPGSAGRHRAVIGLGRRLEPCADTGWWDC